MKRLIYIACLLALFWSAPARAETRQRGVTTSCVGNGTTCVMPRPTGTVDGDLMFTWTATFPNSAAISAPSGWTTVCSETSGIFTNVLFSKVASSQAATENWSNNSNGATMYQVSLFDNSGGSLVLDGIQHTCAHVASGGSTVTPTALTSSVTWGTGVVFMIENQGSATQIATPFNYNTMFQGTAANSVTSETYVNQPASGSFTFSLFQSTANDGGNGFDYATALVKGASAPTVDYRQRSFTTGHTGSSPVSVTPPTGIQNGDLLVGCAFNDDTSTTHPITCPSGFTQFASDTTVRTGTCCCKTAASESGNYSFTSTGTLATFTASMTDLFDNAGGTLLCLKSAASASSSTSNCTSGSVAPTSAADILWATYFFNTASGIPSDLVGYYAGARGTINAFESTGFYPVGTTLITTPPSALGLGGNTAVCYAATLDIGEASPTATPTATPTTTATATPTSTPTPASGCPGYLGGQAGFGCSNLGNTQKLGQPILPNFN